jgi:hypothetical protein
VDEDELDFLKYFVSKLNADPRGVAGFPVIGKIFDEQGHEVDTIGVYP